MGLRVIPFTLEQANAAVASWHRHHNPVVGHRFSIGCMSGDNVVGTAICGRPVSRNVDQTKVIEVTRLVTDGTYNACSILYGASARIAKTMGFVKIQTYILIDEPGTSLKASGWNMEELVKGKTWNTPNRFRRDKAPLVDKQRWARELNPDYDFPFLNLPDRDTGLAQMTLDGVA